MPVVFGRMTMSRVILRGLAVSVRLFKRAFAARTSVNESSGIGASSRSVRVVEGWTKWSRSACRPRGKTDRAEARQVRRSIVDRRTSRVPAQPRLEADIYDCRSPFEPASMSEVAANRSSG